MMRIRSLMLLLIAFIAAPMFAARGSANFTTFVAIGDSYGAGVESASLNLNHQPFSWPAVIARQAGVTDFQQPLVSFPGIGNELQLVDIIHFPPTILQAAGMMGQPINLNLPRPYNNLSVPGATVTDVITLMGKDPANSTAKAFAQFILRGSGTEVQLALAQKPTFVAVWIGGNDALGAVLAGTPAVLTPLETFSTSYNAMLDQLVAGRPAQAWWSATSRTTSWRFLFSPASRRISSTRRRARRSSARIRPDHSIHRRSGRGQYWSSAGRQLRPSHRSLKTSDRIRVAVGSEVISAIQSAS